MKVFIFCTIGGRKMLKLAPLEEQNAMITKVARERMTNKFGPRIVLADTLEHARNLIA